MKTDFKLTGLSKPKSFTCEPLDNENIFWAKSNMTQEQFNALWDYCAQDWKVKKIAVIEHDGFYKDGTPINPIVISIREEINNQVITYKL